MSAKLVPHPASQPPATRRPTPTTLIKAAVAEFETAVGGRAALIRILVSAPTDDPRLDRVVGLIADPSADEIPLAQLCASAGVSVGELLEAYKAGVIMQAQVASFHQMGAIVSVAMADFVAKAVPRDAPCVDCHGTGKGRYDRDAHLTPPCDTCRGVGRLHYDGDLERQVMLFDYLRLAPKSAGPTTNVGVIVPAAPPPAESLATMLRAMDAVLHPRRPAEPATDAEVVESPTVAE